jgi:hypothetical protein
MIVVRSLKSQTVLVMRKWSVVDMTKLKHPAMESESAEQFSSPILSETIIDNIQSFINHPHISKPRYDNNPTSKFQSKTCVAMTEIGQGTIAAPTFIQWIIDTRPLWPVSKKTTPREEVAEFKIAVCTFILCT